MFSLFRKKKGVGAGKRVFVGVSGGVDSSVSLALVRDAGYDVTGVFIRTWHPDWLPCDWKDDRRDAMRVCAHLGVPFLELDLEDVYKKDVADYMISEYRAGRTPNPDVMCNRYVKFGAFWDWAKSRGADYIATGHYARIGNVGELKVKSEKLKVLPTTNYQLQTGIDSSKDQSYFLWTLRADELSHILFPIGHLPKIEVRKLAEKYGLPTARKKDSQGICFLGQVDLREFLSRYIETKQGDVLDEAGHVIGYHDGAIFFTHGERHGFTITKKGTDDARLYVVAKDVEKNTITVSAISPDISSYAKTIYSIILMNFRIDVEVGKIYQAQIRYHGEYWDVQIKDNIVTFTKPVLVSPGQSIVVYDGDICIGGGIVEKAI